jgi:dTDP-glucose 4,6-dehydratase
MTKIVTKLENEFSWKADENFDSGIVKTIEWYGVSND